MCKVTFVSPSNEARTLEVDVDTTCMQAAVAQGVEGVVGECGGAAMCGTCHVYVDEKWVEHVPPMSNIEDELLDCVAAERRPNSRLSCQINASPKLDGIILHIPERQ